ncbi:fimbrial protein [Pantoea sp. Acro-835]|uniref:Fimbrial protein n=2 Tax=Candidatus Pantoea multigeneris TaxID=2608357 RepID=A0ABX0R8C4_9GAMM|nr:fimbrial protein [Pantoea multigeneris]
MKKTLIAMAILGSTAFISSVQAADGTINFTGNITEDACTITASTVKQTIALGTISNKAFSATGSSSPTRFGITLSACPASMTTAKVKFGGNGDKDEPKLLAITTGQDAATGVAIGFYEESGKFLPINAESASKALSDSADTTFNFVTKYVATTKTMTAGEANAVANFTIVYN